MEKLTLVGEEELKTTNGGSEASLGLSEVVGYLTAKCAKYGPSTSTLANCSAT